MEEGFCPQQNQTKLVYLAIRLRREGKNSLQYVSVIYKTRKKSFGKVTAQLVRLCVCWVISHARLFMTPWTVAHQAPLSMGFSRQEYWSGLPCPPPGDLPDSGIELMSPATAGTSFTTVPPGNQTTQRCVVLVGQSCLTLQPMVCPRNF